MEQLNCSKPELETVLIQSVLCSKKVQLAASVKTELMKEAFHNMHVKFIPDPHSIKIAHFLMKDLIIIQGSIDGDLILNNHHHSKITLLFQDEIACDGVCPGDVLKHTHPILKGVIPPQTVTSLQQNYCTVILKVILTAQVTVIREKLGTISVNILDDINEDRCTTPIPMDATIYCNKENHTPNNDCSSEFQTKKEIDQ